LSPVHLRALRLARSQHDLELERLRITRPPECDPACPLPEADQLRVGPSPRREALRADVQRLEQVRLAGAVRADGQDETWLEVELETRVRAVVAKRDRGDDQPASRMGMIRYEKSAPLPFITAGRSGLIRF